MFNKKLKQRIAQLEKKQKEDSDLLNQQRLKIEMLQNQIINPPAFKVGDKIMDFIVVSRKYEQNKREIANKVVKLFCDLFSKNNAAKPNSTFHKPYIYTYKIKNEKTSWEMQVDEEILIELKKAVSKK